MSNGDIAAEIKALLDGKDVIPTRAAMQLMLTMQLQTYKRLDELADTVEGIGARVDVVDRASIVLWVKRNPKTAVFIFALVLAVSIFVDPRDLVLSVLGIHITH